MKTILVLVAITFCVPFVRAQNIEGQPIASEYGTWKVPGYAPNAFNSFAPTSCRVQGGSSFFFPFAVGTPVKIVDSNPGMTETVTPTAVTNSNVDCGIKISAAKQHNVPFYFTSATGGLQEALNANAATPETNTIVLDNKFYQLVGGAANAAAIIASVQGSANLGLEDVTQVPTVWYKWNGSQYVAVSPANAASAATQTSDLIATNNSGILSDLNHYYAISSTYTPQAAVNAAALNNGSATIEPGAGHAVFSNSTYGVKVNDNRMDVPANIRNVKEFGAQCDARPLTAMNTITQGSTTLTVVGTSISPSDTGATLIVVGLVNGLPTAFEPTITYVNLTTATLSTPAPFSQTSENMYLGHDDTAAIQNAVWAERGVQAVGPQMGTPLGLPGTRASGGACLVHAIVWEGASFIGQAMGRSGLMGFPGEDVLQAYDPSNRPSTGQPYYGLGQNVTWKDFSLYVNQEIDATQPWNIVNAAGQTIAQTPVYRPAATWSVVANDPLGPGWITGATNGVASVTNGNAVITVDPSETAPTVGQVVVFPYTSPVFSATVSSVSGQAVTLSTTYTGATSAQQEWFAGSAVQTLSSPITASSTSLPLTLSVAPSPLSEFNVAGHGLVQIDSEQISYFGIDWAGGFQILGLTRGVNGTTAASHSSGAVVVPLNPFQPSHPWPVTPTVTSGQTTPLNAEYYPGFDVGNAAASFPMVNGTVGFGAMYDSSITNVRAYGVGAPISGSLNTSAGWWFDQYPYEDHFDFISAYNTKYGIAEGVPPNNHAFFLQQPTCNASTWNNVKIRAAHAAIMVCGGNVTFSNWGVYNGSSNTVPTPVNEGTGIYMLAGHDDQTGTAAVTGAYDRFTRVYYEANYYDGPPPDPTNELDDFSSRYENDLFGSGYQWAAIGGKNNVFNQVEFLSQPSQPLIVWGANNVVQKAIAINSSSVGNSFTGSSGAISYGINNTITAYAGQSRAEQVTNPNSLGAEGVQEGDFLAAGAAANPFLDYLAGLITPQELESEGGTDPYPMNAAIAVDPTAPVTGNKIGCTFSQGQSGAACKPTRYNGINYMPIGPNQRLIDGQYAFYMPIEATAATTIQFQISACATPFYSGNVVISAANTWQLVTVPLVDFSSLAGRSCSLTLTFNGVGASTNAATVYVAYFGFQPYAQNLYVQNVTFPHGSTGGFSNGCAQSPVTGIDNGFTCPTKGWYSQLAAPEGATDTTITLTGPTSGYSQSGCFFVDSEYECYTGTSGNTLTGLTRGQYATTAAAHANGVEATSVNVVLGSLQQTPSEVVAGGATAPTVVGINNGYPSNHSGTGVLDINSGTNDLYISSSGAIYQNNSAAKSYLNGSVVIGTESIDPAITESGNLLQTNGQNEAYQPLGFAGGLAGSIDIVAPTTIGAPQIEAVIGAGSSTRSYLCTGTDADGNLIPGTTFTGSTYTATYAYPGFISVTCPYTAGVVSYSIWRTAGGPNQGLIASGLPNGGAQTFDYNGSATAGTPTTTNTSNPQLRLHGTGTPSIALGTLATIYAGSGTPTGCGTTYPNSSLYLNSSGTAGSILYACIGTTWTDVK